VTIPLNALQAALYTRLTSELTIPVYDFTPQDSEFPYAVIGADTTIPLDTKTTDGHEFTSTIHLWTKGAGRKALKEQMQAVYDALHEQEIGFLSGTVLVRCEYTETMQDPSSEGDTDHYYHGLLRFRALTQNP
jgi:hypothetical protein